MCKKRALALIFLLSLAMNVLVLVLDVVPTVYPKLQSKFVPEKTLIDQSFNESIISDLVYREGLKMLFSEQPIMSFSENVGFTNRLLNYRSKTSKKEFRLNNYPRSFLMKGIFDYDQSYEKNVNQIVEYFDKEISNLEYKIKRIDQAPLGIVSLELYKKTKNKKYLDFADEVFAYISSLQDQSGIITYRKNQISVLNDTYGLAIPFLVLYGETRDEQAIEMARKNLKFYLDYGLSNSGIPSHGVNKDSLTPVGSSNWGRGIGWFALGLSSFHAATGEFAEEYEALIATLDNLKNNDGLWGQFPGSKDDFDASASLLFIYAQLLSQP